MIAQADAIESTLWLVRTRLHYVLVYRYEPQRVEGGWATRGQIHDFSPNDGIVTDLAAQLVVDEPRACRLSTYHQGRWRLTRTRTAESDVLLFVDDRFVQPFCARFLWAAGVATLPAGQSVWMTFRG
jgi:hypothetical protein